MQKRVKTHSEMTQQVKCLTFLLYEMFDTHTHREELRTFQVRDTQRHTIGELCALKLCTILK